MQLIIRINTSHWLCIHFKSSTMSPQSIQVKKYQNHIVVVSASFPELLHKAQGPKCQIRNPLGYLHQKTAVAMQASTINTIIVAIIIPPNIFIIIFVIRNRFFLGSLVRFL